MSSLPISPVNLAARAAALNSIQKSDVPPLYFILADEPDKVAFYPKDDPNGIDINDRRIVDSAFLSFKHWNRYELAKQLRDFIVSKGKVPPAKALKPLPPGVIPRIGQRGGMNIDWMLKEYLATAPPPLPAGAGTLTIHRGSAVLFLEAEVGHAFTGVVKLPRPDEALRYVRPKIFLVAIQPSLKSATDPYAVRPHPAKRASVIYGKPFDPIVHLGTAGGLAAHTQLSAAVASKEKFKSLRQDAGDFIGFTVSKGALLQGISNRYSFTSASSNAGSFPIQHDKKHPNCPTEEWGKQIKLACDALLKLDADIDNRAMVLNGKEGWKGVREIYWPCAAPPVRSAEHRVEVTEVEDEWETD